MFRLDCNPVHTNVHLHPQTVDILFTHKGDIFRKLSDLIGLHYIDHVALYLVNPDQEMVIFSLIPSVEFNLLVQGLWPFDNAFQPQSQESENLVFWDQAYMPAYKHAIKSRKETHHHFSLGFNIARKIQGFTLIYAFATRHIDDNLRAYYAAHVSELMALGDYGYKQLLPLYQQYCSITPPMMDTPPLERRLKLVVNNS